MAEMEEAYSELYQQYLRLRSLCLKQAALLHQLTADLQKQQTSDHKHCHTDAHCDVTGHGANTESGVLSTQVQSTQETPVCLHEKPQQLKITAPSPAAHCGTDGPHGPNEHVGTFSDLLTEDMSKLCVDLPLQKKEDRNLDQNIAPLLSVDSPGWQGASFNVSKTPDQAVYFGGDQTMLANMLPLPGGSTLVDDFLCPSSGMLVSDVALQSHVCEFCQAVFPGNTTTRGEFLRHLYTHVT